MILGHHTQVHYSQGWQLLGLGLRLRLTLILTLTLSLTLTTTLTLTLTLAFADLVVKAANAYLAMTTPLNGKLVLFTLWQQRKTIISMKKLHKQIIKHTVLALCVI